MAAACRMQLPWRLLPHSPTPTRVAAYEFPLSTHDLGTADGERRARGSQRHANPPRRVCDDDDLLLRSRTMKGTQKPRPSASGTGTSASIRAALQDFLEQQHRLDAQRQEAEARRAEERLIFERQWREAMQRLERERLALEQAWMEREEQRRIREEARAERRDALLTTLLNRLLHDDF